MKFDVIYLVFVSSWMMFISSFQHCSHKLFFMTMSTGINHNRMMPKHLWGEEYEEFGFIYNKSKQEGKQIPIYGTLVQQQCKICGSAREREKSLETWSNIWNIESMALLECQLQSTITYRDEHWVIYY